MNKTAKIILIVVGVLVILGILLVVVLGALLFSQFGTVRDTAQDVKRISDINNIGFALNIYIDEFGAGPMGLEELASENIIQPLPTDPETGENYGYLRIPDKQGGYHIWAFLGSGPPMPDDDYDSSMYGGVDGALESCTSLEDCVYDLYGF